MSIFFLLIMHLSFCVHWVNRDLVQSMEWHVCVTCDNVSQCMTLSLTVCHLWQSTAESLGWRRGRTDVTDRPTAAAWDGASVHTDQRRSRRHVGVHRWRSTRMQQLSGHLLTHCAGLVLKRRHLSVTLSVCLLVTLFHLLSLAYCAYYGTLPYEAMLGTAVCLCVHLCTVCTLFAHKTKVLESQVWCTWSP